MPTQDLPTHAPTRPDLPTNAHTHLLASHPLTGDLVVPLTTLARVKAAHLEECPY